MSEEKVKKSKGGRSVVADIAFIIVAIILIVLIVRVISAKVKGEVYFAFNKYTMVWVLTGSMEKEIPAESYILVEKVNQEDVSKLKKDDVITFYSEDPKLKGQLNTHRIYDIDTGENGELIFTTKGDNNLAIDEYTVKGSEIVGKYITHLGFLSVIGKLFTSIYGLFIVGGLIILMALLMFIKSFKEAAKEEAGEKEHDEEMNKLIAEEVERLKQQNQQNDVPAEEKLEENKEDKE